jgi:hypothetical protein
LWQEDLHQYSGRVTWRISDCLNGLIKKKWLDNW